MISTRSNPFPRLLIVIGLSLFVIPQTVLAASSQSDLPEAATPPQGTLSAIMKFNSDPSLPPSFEKDGWIGRVGARVTYSCACPQFGQQDYTFQTSPNLDLYRTPPISGSGVKMTRDKVNRGYYGLRFSRSTGASQSNGWLAPYVGIQSGSASMTFRSNLDTTFMGVSLNKNSLGSVNQDTVGGLIGTYFRPWDGMSANIGTAFIDRDVAVEAKIQYAF